MTKDYTKYTADQLLEDDFFVNSIKNPTRETDLYWKLQVADGIVDNKEFAIARQFLYAMQVKKSRMPARDYTNLWKKIDTTNHQVSHKKSFPFYKLFVAAGIALLLGIGTFLFFFSEKGDDSLRLFAQTVKPEEDIQDVQLILSDNERISINEEKIEIQYDQQGSIWVNTTKIAQESNTSTDKQEINQSTPAKKINQLIVPKGKRSTLTFSDGTLLWVNAGSRVIYPEQFEEKAREIYIDGEAYLQVKSDASRPFIVKTRNMDVKVLGTSFNITAYEEDHFQVVALVEGKVEIYSEKEKLAIMTPNDLFKYENGEKSIEQKDISDYISWIEGWYGYQSERLPVILDRLSRYYGKKIIYNKEIGHIRCTGKLDLQDDLKKVMTALTETAPICYEMNENIVSVVYNEN